ncbi:MAG TPA: WD40 repeat domain-containing protein, partial [Gemmataceae bacterium]|nr:WD40 repeat domain-containing protein [Gemmataceae bacterium]
AVSGDIHWLDMATGKEIRRLHVDLTSFDVGRWAVSPDGKRLAAMVKPSVLYLWNAVTGEEISRTALGQRDHNLCFSADSQTLACNVTAADRPPIEHSRDTILFAAQNGQELARWRNDGSVDYIAYSPDGKTLALSLMRTVIDLRDAKSGKPAIAINRLPDLALSLSFAPDSKSLTIGSRGGHISTWDPLTGKQQGQYQSRPADAIPQLQYLYATSFTGDGQKAALIDAKGVLHVWEPLSGKTLFRIEGMPTPPGGPTPFSPDGKLLAAPYKKGTLGIWETATGKLQYTLSPPSVAFPAFSIDGRFLATATGSFDGVPYEMAIRVWHADTGKLKTQLTLNSGPRVVYLAFSADGKYLISRHQDSDLEAKASSSSVRLWDLATSREISRFATPEAADWPSRSSVVLSPDAKTIAWPSQDGVVLWEMATGQVRGRFKGHRGKVHALAFSPNGRMLVSGGSDLTALVWDVTGICPDGKWSAHDLTAAEVDKLWADLGGDDGIAAYRATWKLAATFKQSLPFFREQLIVKPADAQLTAKLIAELDSSIYATREKAVQSLVALGESAEAALREVLKTNAPLEVRRRIELVLEKRTLDLIRKLRAIEALEHCKAPEARRVLEALTKATPNPRLAEAADEALKRLLNRGS